MIWTIEATDSAASIVVKNLKMVDWRQENRQLRVTYNDNSFSMLTNIPYEDYLRLIEIWTEYVKVKGY